MNVLVRQLAGVLLEVVFRLETVHLVARGQLPHPELELDLAPLDLHLRGPLPQGLVIRPGEFDIIIE